MFRFQSFRILAAIRGDLANEVREARENAQPDLVAALEKRMRQHPRWSLAIIVLVGATVFLTLGNAAFDFAEHVHEFFLRPNKRNQQ